VNITLKILGTCASGGHITVEATIDGGAKKTMTIMRSQLVNPLADVEVEDALAIILRNHIKEQGLSTPLQIKNYVEGHTFKW
jgi:hypothetical protein